MLRRLALAAAIVALYWGALFTTNGCTTLDRAVMPQFEPTLLLVHVSDAGTGAPLQRVRVSLQGLRGQTNENGEYIFDRIKPRPSLLAATLEGYVDYKVEVTPRERELNEHDVVMRAR